jgi:hypothetical protein
VPGFKGRKMKIQMTVRFDVDVPAGVNVEGLYLNIPYEFVEVVSLNDDEPLDAVFEGHATETVAVVED